MKSRSHPPGAVTAPGFWDARRLRNLVTIFAATAVIFVTTGFRSSVQSVSSVKRSHPQSLKQQLPSPKTVALTPDLVRKILNLPESDQKALILPPATKSQEHEQLFIINRDVLSEESGHAATGAPLKEEEASRLVAVNPELRERFKEEEGTTPTQDKAIRTWSIIFVTLIATASVVFETCRELLERSVPADLLPVVERFLAELATLGFIGTVTFLSVHFGILKDLSIAFTGTAEMLTEELETLHYLVFCVMCFFIACVLVLLVNAIRQEQTWRSYEEAAAAAMEEARQKRDTQATKKKASIKDAEAGAEGETKTTPRGRRGSMVPKRSLELIRNMAAVEREADLELLRAELINRKDEVERAEFLRFRARFIQHPDLDVTIPVDFSFARYMSRCASKDLVELLEVGVYDWVIIWFVFAGFFALVTLVRMIGGSFGEMLGGEVDQHKDLAMRVSLAILLVVLIFVLLAAAVLVLIALLGVKARLSPALIPAPGQQGGGQYGSLENVADAHDLVSPPPFLKETKAVVEESADWVTYFLSFTGKSRKPNRHEQLFAPFGSKGPQVYLFAIRHLVLLSTVAIAASFTVLFKSLYESFFMLPFLVFLVAVAVLFVIPAAVRAYTWCCSVEQLKRPEVVLQVLREQKHEKLLRVVKSLSRLSLFIDKIDMLSKVGANQASEKELTDTQWKELMKRVDPKEVEELEVLFDSFDKDKSGELEEDEVKDLVAHYLSTPMSDEEASQLFRVMDVDGSGTVDFREFATVILRHRSGDKEAVLGPELADKIFGIFDREGKGLVSEDQVVDAVLRLGRNVDISSIRFLFQQMDQDGSGEVTRFEFADFLRRVREESGH